MSNKLLVVIGGPTGIGKSEVAIQLAQHYHTEVVNADSRQVYKELVIGVGRPTPAQLLAVPHHLIGHVSIQAPYDVSMYTKDALAVVEKLFSMHEMVILTGGTGLYVKALTEGLDDIPEVNDEINERWNMIWKERGTPALVDALKELDPVYLLTVDQSNPMRLIRALAVSESAGKPYSSFRTGIKRERSFRTLSIVLERPREDLYHRINERVTKMIDQGWLDEARTLYPYRPLKALQTLGYRELFEFIEGQKSMIDAISEIQQSTRRYAKRQITWWRNQGIWQSFNPEDINSLIASIDKESAVVST